MINMSYCRFENTYHALMECEEALAEIESLNDLSEREKKHAKELIRLCEVIYNDFELMVYE